MLPQLCAGDTPAADDYYEAMAGLLSWRQWACTRCIPTSLRSVFVCLRVVRRFVYRDIDIGMMLRSSYIFCTHSCKGESKYFLASKMEIFPSACRGHLSTWYVMGWRLKWIWWNSCQKVQVHWKRSAYTHSCWLSHLLWNRWFCLTASYTLKEVQINTIVLHIK